MGPRRRLIAAVLIAAAAAAGWLAVPRRFAVDGVSMGPSLLPDDLVRTGAFPALHRWRRPVRFERWVLAATDDLVLKRLIGLPGEEVSLVAGDLAIDGELVLKGPRILAEIGSVVSAGPAAVPPRAEEGWAWMSTACEVLDDAAFDEGTTRTLEAVRDGGLVAVVDVRAATTAAPAVVRIRVGRTIVERPLEAPGRHAAAAGRLDGRLVVATWPVAATARPTGPRSCLATGSPAAWQVAEPWPGPDAGDSAPALAIGGDDRVTVVDVIRWRDVAWRPGADGRASWRLGPAEVFVLGDHPAASTDSRRWGPIRTAALRYRVAAGGR